MPRFAQTLPLDAVKRRLFERLRSQRYAADQDPTLLPFDWSDLLYNVRFEPGFQAVFRKDLSKVGFDLENIGTARWGTGPFVMVNGVPMLFAWAGGDWEWPVHFVLYVDPQHQVRGYVPQDGNRYNRATKQAYGNDDEADELDLQQHFGTDDWNYATTDAEHTAMLADVAQRVQVKA